MFNLLKIKVSGFRMLSDGFELNLLSKARVSENDDEIINIQDNLNTFNTIAFTGGNSSGKSTTLELIEKVLIFIRSGRWVYNSFDFNKQTIELEIYFYYDNYIYKHVSSLVSNNNTYNNDRVEIKNCIISKEYFGRAKYKTYVGKKIESLSYMDIYLNDDLNVADDTAYLRQLRLQNLPIYGLYDNDNIFATFNWASYLDILHEDLTLSIISLLDDSIEYIKNTDYEMLLFKRYGEDEVELTVGELFGILSKGTIRGIKLYIEAISAIKNGGILFIDEIENSFHKNLVNNILFLFSDPKININKAQIILTTHYVEILDIFERRDNIFILHKDNNHKIIINNLYSDYNFRSELQKSSGFNNNSFNTLLNYEKLMKVKRLIKNEVLNNDRRVLWKRTNWCIARKKIDIYRIGDKFTDKLTIPENVKRKINDVINVCTKPEFEILHIINSGHYNDFIKQKSVKKPSEYYKEIDKHYNKTYEYQYSYFNKFTNKEILNLLQNYKTKRGKINDKDNSLTLYDIVKHDW